MRAQSYFPTARKYLPVQPTKPAARSNVLTTILASLLFLPLQADLNGFWSNQYTPNLAQALGHEPPYTPYGAERWKNVDTKDDPTGKCLPVGPSRAFTAPFPFQVVQGPRMIAFLYEYQTIYRM